MADAAVEKGGFDAGLPEQGSNVAELEWCVQVARMVNLPRRRLADLNQLDQPVHSLPLTSSHARYGPQQLHMNMSSKFSASTSADIRAYDLTSCMKTEYGAAIGRFAAPPRGIIRDVMSNHGNMRARQRSNLLH